MFKKFTYNLKNGKRGNLKQYKEMVEVEEIGRRFLEHVSLADAYLNFSNFTPKTLYDWIYPLAESIIPEGAIPYLIETSNRFRASPLASAIIWLNNAHLLPPDVLDKLQNSLIMLKDNNIENDSDPGVNSKKAEDLDGWSLGEGVSVWSTSMAIIALLDSCGIGIKKSEKIRPAILWLAEQRSLTEKGWAYQNTANCKVNPIMTALAMRAISISLSEDIKNKMGFSSNEITKLEGALFSGFEYLKSNIHISKSKRKAYWSFNNVSHCAATTWALLALQQMALNDPNKYKEFFNNYRIPCLSFIMSKIPTESTKWDDEQIVYEGGAKYNKQKNYFSYSATLIPELISLGVSPYNPKIINQVKWLINNPDNWKITGYDISVTCTFTYAMIISVLAHWVSKIGSENAVYLVKSTQTKFEKFIVFITGMPFKKGCPFQMVLKSNLIIWLIIVIIAMVIIFFLRDINNNIEKVATYIVNLWEKTSTDRHAVLVNIISTLIYPAIVAALGLILSFIRKLFRKK